MTSCPTTDSTDYINQGSLSIHPALWEFINSEALTPVNLDKTAFWLNFESLLKTLQPQNKALLAKRDQLQEQIDSWHQTHPEFNFVQYKQFLKEVGYLVDVPEQAHITTEHVDPEIATMGGHNLWCR